MNSPGWNAELPRWVIYALLSLTTALLGAICVFLSWREVGISLMSAGVTSGLFLTQKVVDDISQRDDRARQAAGLAELAVLVRGHDSVVERLRHAMVAATASMGVGADERVAAARHLTVESTQLIAQVGPDDVLEIDAIGISLKQLLMDHESVLTSRKKLRARLIILDSQTATFDLAVTWEGRDAAVMRAQIAYVVSAVSRIVAARRDRGWNAGVELRLFDGIMTTTGIRVADTWFFRPRFANEAVSIQFFFERYDSAAPNCFRTVCAQFAALWENARPTGSAAPAQRSAGSP